MGRPLFSARSPAVRVEPEPQQPTYEKWTYWNAFDPDSDEFFENDDAVYEAFIDPADRIQLPADRAQPSAVVDVDVSSSSEASSSGRGTPMEVVDADAPDTASEARREILRASGMRALDDPSPRNAVLDAEIEAGRDLPSQERVLYYLSLMENMENPQGRERRNQQEPRPTVRERIPTYLDLPQEESRTPSPEPVALSRAIPIPSTPARPSTPPAQNTPLFASPSPPPSVTPRLYSWSSLAPAPGVPGSPLTNRGARMSVAHIVAPPLVPAYRVA
ncbi:hypothetical protein C8Q80DRAFT_1124660 [Daedaleopsis nitida]|nr:hypothetical protein C8Q80DRAFT_1124660 [Daedaleopsis nitida]